MITLHSYKRVLGFSQLITPLKLIRSSSELKCGNLFGMRRILD